MSLKIVYLDDENDLCDIFRESMEANGFQIWTFTKPDDFMREVVEIKPDLVILDFRLPGTRGDIIAQKLDASLAKIMVTGDFEVVDEGLFLRVFPKPYDMDLLVAYILTIFPHLLRCG